METIDNLYHQHILPWISCTKDKIQEDGITLPKKYEHIAKLAQIENTDKIRVLYTDKIVLPFKDLFGENIDIANINGIALGYDILIQKDAPESTLFHELRHIAQYELFDNLDLFIQIYIKEFLKFRYKKGPLEKDAVSFVNELLLKLSR